MKRFDVFLSVVFVTAILWVAVVTWRVASSTIAIGRLENRVYELEQRTAPPAPRLETEE